MEASYRARGRPLPDHLHPPPILPGFESWMEAFFELGTERPRTMDGVGPIPRSAIVAYAQEITDAYAENTLFRNVMVALDVAYLTFTRDGFIPDDETPVSTNPARDYIRAALRRG